MAIETRIRFRDGSEEIRYWPDDCPPAKTLTAAIRLAEFQRGEDHDGAWLEFGYEDHLSSAKS